MAHTAPRHWRSRSPLALGLYPLSLLFASLSALRRGLYRRSLLPRVRLPVPVVVVGNIAVGGSGKTPVVEWLVARLRDAGYSPGVVSRGYGGRFVGVRTVEPDADPEVVGDEPLCLARSCRCPVAIGVDRPAAADLLVAAGCDVIVSDDGLQHYRMVRDVEVVVLDPLTLGNRWLLPAGPLREGVSRLASADVVIIHGEPDAVLRSVCAAVPTSRMRLLGDTVWSLAGDGAAQALSAFAGQRVHAYAGIGRPERFFAQLAAAGVDVVPHAFADHHRFVAADFDSADDAPKILTAKDAVKCQQFGLRNAWVLPVRAEIDAGAAERIVEMLEHGRKTA